MRTVKTLKPENRGVGRPAALSGTRGRVLWIADARRPGRGCCDPAGGTAGRLAEEGRTTTGEVRRRPSVEVARFGEVARCGNRAEGTGCLDVDTSA